MSKASKQPTPKERVNKTAKTGEFEVKVLARSDWPRTPKETIKFVLYIILNFFPF